MDTYPKVSIIVPVYNTEQYLEKCLDSLVNQSLDNIEIVVINDGATDSSPAIIERYQSAYPEKFLVLNQENSGQAAARNRGIEAARGAYIAFLDSDDYMDYHALQKMYEVITEEEADMVYCDFWLELGNDISRMKVRPCKDTRDLFIDCLVTPWNKMYRANLLKEHDIRFPEGYFYEDTGWFIETIPWINKFAQIDAPLIYHLERPGSTMTELSDKRVQHIFPVLGEMLDYYREQELFEQYFDEIEFFCTKMLLFSSMVRIGRIRDWKEIIKQVKNTFRFLNDNFPNYRRNKYFGKGIRHLYVRYAAAWNVPVILGASRIRRKISGKELNYNICK